MLNYLYFSIFNSYIFNLLIATTFLILSLKCYGYSCTYVLLPFGFYVYIYALCSSDIYDVTPRN